MDHIFFFAFCFYMCYFYGGWDSNINGVERILTALAESVPTVDVPALTEV